MDVVVDFVKSLLNETDLCLPFIRSVPLPFTETLLLEGVVTGKCHTVFKGDSLHAVKFN